MKRIVFPKFNKCTSEVRMEFTANNQWADGGHLYLKELSYIIIPENILLPVYTKNMIYRFQEDQRNLAPIPQEIMFAMMVLFLKIISNDMVFCLKLIICLLTG